MIRASRKLLYAILLVVPVLAASAPAQASLAAYSGYYVFGDSLSDSGNVFALTGGAIPPPPYYQGHFSNGPTYAENLAARLGFDATPSLLGGNDFAFGGATAGGTGTPIPSLGDQVSSFRARAGSADGGALYVLWAGGNDLRDDPGATGIDSALTGVASAVQELYQEGARNFLVMSLPDLGLIPEVRAAGPAAMAAVSFGASIFNTNLGGLLDTLRGSLGGSDIRSLDTFSLIGGIVADPAASGFANATDVCFDGAFVCADPDSFLFWDDIHPTAAGHRLIADAAYGVLAVPEAGTWALMLAGIGLIAARVRRARTRNSLMPQA